MHHHESGEKSDDWCSHGPTGRTRFARSRLGDMAPPAGLRQSLHFLYHQPSTWCAQLIRRENRQMVTNSWRDWSDLQTGQLRRDTDSETNRKHTNTAARTIAAIFPTQQISWQWRQVGIKEVTEETKQKNHPRWGCWTIVTPTRLEGQSN